MDKVTVVGAGNMGSGIAQAFATAGCVVTMCDVDEAAIRRGRERIEGPLRKRVEAGRMALADVHGIMQNLRGEVDLKTAVADADLVVEAVFEDLKVKQDLFARLDKVAPKKTAFATNTSSFYVADLAAATQRGDRVLGLHFFFPAAINKLVEVVHGPKTDPAVFDAVWDVVRRAGKVPIRTADAPGFAVNRFFVPWINEACRLHDQGINIATIEAAAKEAFGITMGPFELMNVTGVPISLHAQTTLHKELGPFYEPAKGLVAQVAKKKDWDLSGTVDKATVTKVQSRLRGVVYGIACHLVKEGVASRKDIDRGATIGLRWAKGPFAMMNEQGLADARQEIAAIARTWPEAFAVPEDLPEEWHLPAVVVEVESAVATIRFDRPEALNALDRTVLADLDACLDEVEKAKVRAVIVTGEGKAFVAGADIPTMKALDAAGARDYTTFGNRVLDRLAALPCPVIMAVNGFALGGGLELALCGDLLYASDRAKLGLPEVGLGIHPGFGGTQRLPRRVGVGRAKELIYTGRTLDAEEAARIGLVNSVVPHDELFAHCAKVAKTIAGMAPLAVTGAKRSMDEGLGMPLGQGLLVEQESVALLFATKDKDEGLAAFLERRKAAFKGT